MIVADASVVVDLLLGSGSEAGDALSERMGTGGPVCAPDLLDAEVGQTLRRYAGRGEISDASADEMVDDLLDLRIWRYPHTSLLRRAFDLRHDVTIYDGLYLALAEALECSLLTGDAALAGVPGTAARVEVVTTGG